MEELGPAISVPATKKINTWIKAPCEKTCDTEEIMKMDEKRDAAAALSDGSVDVSTNISTFASAIVFAVISVGSNGSTDPDISTPVDSDGSDSEPDDSDESDGPDSDDSADGSGTSDESESESESDVDEMEE
ncbi:hypothetical protein BJ508DRAFT_335739 [Ascobolus immersus RN42]|uniref:Uncharacterized protein n=1 Tax=Ascobolus immersus RN42 TaxID=1160509 RepID=A0A3N4HHD5_ASCIM|nr:hypothetical protein BJ508DRAFT_335739 [Ascobolus immersus RN42]